MNNLDTGHCNVVKVSATLEETTPGKARETRFYMDEWAYVVCFIVDRITVLFELFYGYVNLDERL